MQRLPELVCVEVIRVHLWDEAGVMPGWFRDLRDEALRSTLEGLHRHPGEARFVGRLVAAAQLLPSRFAARFADAMGESCMAYVTRWRMTLACNLLRTTDVSVEAFANRVGYESGAAFSRVFRRSVGLSAARWRQEMARLRER